MVLSRSIAGLVLAGFVASRRSLRLRVFPHTAQTRSRLRCPGFLLAPSWPCSCRWPTRVRSSALVSLPAGPITARQTTCSSRASAWARCPFSAQSIPDGGCAKDFANARTIDPLSNLTKRRVYVFSGTDDSIVRQPAVDATVSFFQQVGVKEDNLKYVNKVPAGHALITPSYGNDCSANAAPYISHCNVGSEGYDQAGAILQHIYGALNPRVDTPTGQIVSFNQRAYAAAATGMADTAYLYVPQSCTTAGAHCKVHVAIHGCMQAAESVGNQFYTERATTTGPTATISSCSIRRSTSRTRTTRKAAGTGGATPARTTPTSRARK